MKRLLLLSLVLFSLNGFASHDWSYHSPNGPQEWGNLPGSSTCQTGKRQSPIEITTEDKHQSKLHLAPDLLPLEVSWKDSHLLPIAKKHHLEVPYQKGSHLSFQGKKFELKQFHFHFPSEHTLNGRHYPLEMHFVHADEKGRLLVVGLFLEEGEWNEELAKVLERPSHQGIDAKNFLPRELGYFNYQGSLTTPPCSEGVTWIVLEHAIKASKEQIGFFPKKYHEHNNRPLRPLNDRMIKKAL